MPIGGTVGTVTIGFTVIGTGGTVGTVTIGRGVVGMTLAWKSRKELSERAIQVLLVTYECLSNSATSSL